MSDRDRVGCQAPVPVGHPGLHPYIGLAARWGHRPLFGLTPRKQIGVFRLQFCQRRSLPLAVTDLAQAIVDCVARKRKLQNTAHQVHGLAGAAKRTGDEWKRRNALAVAPEQVSEDMAGVNRLLAAECVERNVLYALEPPQRVPLGLAVANVVDDRHIPTPSLPAIAARRTAAFPLAYAQQSIFKSLLYD